MKVYMDDEKTDVDLCPHNGHSVGWTVMTETIVLVKARLCSSLFNRICYQSW